MQSSQTHPGNQSPSQQSTPPHAPRYTKSRWTAEEDQLLTESVMRNGTSNWSLVSMALKNRTGKQCRERWINHLSPGLKSDIWTQPEDQHLLQLIAVHGHQWASIAKFFDGRSTNSVKNRWGWLKRHSSYMNYSMMVVKTARMPHKLPEVILNVISDESSEPEPQGMNNICNKKNGNHMYFPQLPFNSHIEPSLNLSMILAQ